MDALKTRIPVKDQLKQIDAENLNGLHPEAII